MHFEDIRTSTVGKNYILGHHLLNHSLNSNSNLFNPLRSKSFHDAVQDLPTESRTYVVSYVRSSQLSSNKEVINQLHYAADNLSTCVRNKLSPVSQYDAIVNPAMADTHFVDGHVTILQESVNGMVVDLAVENLRSAYMNVLNNGVISGGLNSNHLIYIARTILQNRSNSRILICANSPVDISNLRSNWVLFLNRLHADGITFEISLRKIDFFFRGMGINASNQHISGLHNAYDLLEGLLFPLNQTTKFRFFWDTLTEIYYARLRVGIDRRGADYIVDDIIPMEPRETRVIDSIVIFERF